MDLNNFSSFAITIQTSVVSDFSIITDFTANTYDDKLVIYTADNREISLPADGWQELIDENALQYINGDVRIWIEQI